MAKARCTDLPRLPGDRRLANRARILKAGTVLPAALVAEVKAIAAG